MSLKNITSNLVRIAGLLVGLAIFAFTIQKFGGLSAVGLKLYEAKFCFAFVVLNSFLWMISYTVAWQRLLSGLKNKIRFLSLLKIKLSGEGINFMTPLGFMGGDPVRVLLLKKHIEPEGRLRSVVVDRVMTSLAAQVFCLFGALLLFTQDVSFPLWLHIIFLCVYVFLTFIFFSLLISLLSGHGFGFLTGIIHWLPLHRFFPKVEQTLEDLKESLEYYKRRSRKGLYFSFACHLMGRVLGAVELYIIFYFFEGHADFVFSIILASITSFFAISFGFIPGALGVIETVYASFFKLYGFDPSVGLSMQLIRRLRVLFWIGVGLLVLDHREISNFIVAMRRNKLHGHHPPT